MDGGKIVWEQHDAENQVIAARLCLGERSVVTVYRDGAVKLWRIQSEKCSDSQTLGHINLKVRRTICTIS